MNDYKKLYGFIKPNGEFIMVDYGCHLDFAEDYIYMNGMEEEYYEIFGKEGFNVWSKVDFLVQIKKFVLLHNSTKNCLPYPQTSGRVTKKQKDALYKIYEVAHESLKGEVNIIMDGIEAE